METGTQEDGSSGGSGTRFLRPLRVDDVALVLRRWGFSWGEGRGSLGPEPSEMGWVGISAPSGPIQQTGFLGVHSLLFFPHPNLLPLLWQCLV